MADIDLREAYDFTREIYPRCRTADEFYSELTSRFPDATPHAWNIYRYAMQMAKQDQQDAEKQKEKIAAHKVEPTRKEKDLSSGWISFVIAWCKSWGWRIAAVVGIFLIFEDVPRRVHDAAMLVVSLAAVSGYGVARLLRRESQALDIGLLSGAIAAVIILVILLFQGAYFQPLRMNPV